MAVGSQRDYLFELINRWRSNRIDAIGGPYDNKLKIPVPDAVKQARARISRDQKIVGAWENKRRVAHKAATNKIEREYQVLREKILFMDPQEALKLIKRALKGA